MHLPNAEVHVYNIIIYAMCCNEKWKLNSSMYYLIN